MKYLVAGLITSLAISAQTKNTAILQTAEAFGKQGNLFEAITEYKRLLHNTAKPDEKVFAAFKIGNLYHKSRNYAKAHEYYQKSLEQSNSSGATPALRSTVLVRLKMLDVRNAGGYDLWPDIKDLQETLEKKSFDSERLKLNSAYWFASRGAYTSATGMAQMPLANVELDKERTFLLAKLGQPPHSMSRYNVLWSVFPGGLYFRMHEFSKGFLSLFTVTSLAGAAALSFSGGYAVSGIIFSVFSFRFFLDSVAVSFSLLNEKNEKLHSNFQKSFHDPERFSSHVVFKYPFSRN